MERVAQTVIAVLSTAMCCVIAYCLLSWGTGNSPFFSIETLSAVDPFFTVVMSVIAGWREWSGKNTKVYKSIAKRTMLSQLLKDLALCFFVFIFIFLVISLVTGQGFNLLLRPRFLACSFLLLFVVGFSSFIWWLFARKKYPPQNKDSLSVSFSNNTDENSDKSPKA